jgi:hypothetical protein
MHSSGKHSINNWINLCVWQVNGEATNLVNKKSHIFNNVMLTYNETCQQITFQIWQKQNVILYHYHCLKITHCFNRGGFIGGQWFLTQGSIQTLLVHHQTFGLIELLAWRFMHIFLRSHPRFIIALTLCNIHSFIWTMEASYLVWS